MKMFVKLYSLDPTPIQNLSSIVCIVCGQTSSYGKVCCSYTKAGIFLLGYDLSCLIQYTVQKEIVLFTELAQAANYICRDGSCDIIKLESEARNQT